MTNLTHKIYLNEETTVTIINLCPHPIDIRGIEIPESKWIARKLPTGGTSYTKSEKKILQLGELEIRKMSEMIKLRKKDEKENMIFPPEMDRTFYVVSSLTASYLGNRRDILIPDYKNTKEGKIARGLLAFNKATFDNLEELT